jgi:hypothetical protein
MESFASTEDPQHAAVRFRYVWTDAAGSDSPPSFYCIDMITWTRTD